ncbi:MAG: tryptophan 7-halogenase [Oceanicaulis sp.]
MSQNNNAPGAPVSKIVIVGGGSAGWMSAAACATAVEGGCAVELVESDDIAIVGVGEATIPAIRQFNAFLGLDEGEFMASTQASYKLGIRFSGWAHERDDYFHPFGTYGRDFDWLPLFQYYLQARAQGDDTPLQAYSLAWLAASENRFAMPDRDPRTALSTLDYAYHFDAVEYGRYLRRVAQARGVKRTEGTVADVEKRDDDGSVSALILEDGRRVEGDFFIDCTGFRGLLIEGSLKTGYDDWSRYLPCDRAIAAPCAHGDDFTPYTRSAAQRAGWRWRIPLQHRVGNGYVHCSEFISEDEATSTLLSQLEAPPIADPRVLRFKTGRRRKAWNRNVLAVGLSAGFLEPLESTSLHLIHSGIMRFLAMFPHGRRDTISADEYNRITEEEWLGVRDFLILHYAANQRQDGELWRHTASMALPESLIWRMEHFRARGRVVSAGHEIFQEVNWISVLMGQGVEPQRHDPLAAMRSTNGAQLLSQTRQVLASAASKMGDHRAFIDQHRAAPAARIA